MQAIRKSLSLRIAVPVITVAVTLGTFLYSFVLATISDFARTDIENDLKAISHQIYNICNSSYDDMLQSNPADDPTAHIITKALTLGQMEDLFRQESIQGFVYDIRDTKYLVETALPEAAEELDTKVSTMGVVTTLNGYSKDHFALKFGFSPWQWQIVIIKNEKEYSHLIKRVQRVYIYTLSLLFVATALLVLFLYRSVASPVLRISKPLQEARKPNYKGIEVFEFLSDTISDMMCSIKQSERKFRSLVETTKDFVWEINSDGIYTYASPAIKEILGYTPVEVVGKHVSYFHAQKNKQEMDNQLQYFLYSEKGVEKVLAVCRHKNGKEVFLESSGVPVFDEDDEFTGYQGIDRDITERLLAEKKHKEYEMQQQQEKLETLGTLAGGIAHDFNNLLSVISGNLSLAKAMSNEKQIQPFLDKATSSIEKAGDLTAQLVTFAKGGVPNKSLCEVGPLIQELCSELTEEFDVKCLLDIPEDLADIRVDRQQLKRALHNIAVNAVESMSKAPEIGVSCANISAQELDNADIELHKGQYIRIVFEDSGVGIELKDIQKIFDPYYTTKQMGSEKGMGLGLTISFSIVQRHGGHILVESEVGAGTVITVLLPAEKEGAGSEDICKKKRAATTGKVRKVLLMDDEEMIRDLAEMMFVTLGHDYILTKDGSETLSCYQDALETGTPFDLVILDLTIKDGMSGLETIQKLLEIDPDVRAVVSSGYSGDPAMLDHEDHGFVDTLPKPYELKDMQAILTG